MMRLFFILSLLYIPLQNISAQNTATLTQKLHTLIQGYEAVYGFSGTIKVVLKDEATFEESYGLANRSFDIKNTSSTRYSINSISKTFTATGILLLVKEGKLDLHKPISQYLNFLTASWKDSITTHHLLSHTSGLSRESGVQPHDEKSLEEQAKMVDKKTLLFTSGERYEYSNAGIILLGAILQSVSGEQYADFIEKRIIEPIGLKNTGVYRGRAFVKNQAVPYRFSTNGIVFQQRSKHYGENAGGNLYSTVGDLYEYVLAIEQNKILPKDLTQLLFHPHVASGESDYEGYAWSIKQFGDEKIHFAAGSGYGTKSVIIRSPQEGNFIGITANWGDTPILNMLRDIFLMTKGATVTPPTTDALAKAEDFKEALGKYSFEKGQLKEHLGIDSDEVILQAFEDKVFWSGDVLAQKGEGKLGLTYTDELIIVFEEDKMIIDMNGNRLEGKRSK